MILEILRMTYHPVKYHDITKYHDMYNNGDYGACSFHYMYIQLSYSNSGAVSRHSYVMPYCQHCIARYNNKIITITYNSPILLLQSMIYSQCILVETFSGEWVGVVALIRIHRY